MAWRSIAAFAPAASLAIAAALSAPTGSLAQTFTTLHSFAGGSDGQYPTGGLVLLGQALYGTTQLGGASNLGTIFTVRPSGEAVPFSFGDEQIAEPAAGLTIAGGYLFGTGTTGNGGVFRFDPRTDESTDLYQFPGGLGGGATPEAPLLNVGGALYGTTFGDYYSAGTVFEIDPASGAEKVLHLFCEYGTGDGCSPHAALINLNGTLYGTTEAGGAFGNGTVYAIDPASGVEKVVYAFGASDGDGAVPEAGLVAVNGLLYGTTAGGGAFGRGTVFSLNLVTGSEAVVLSFNQGGSNPESPLISIDGLLYGTTTSGGGVGGRGVIFRLNPTTGIETPLHVFTGPDGDTPLGALIDVRGTLYGTTERGGGPAYDGTVFSLAP